MNRISLPLKLFTPYLAVLVFWNYFHSAWLTILCYHALALILSWKNFSRLKGHLNRTKILLMLPTILTGLIAYALIPCICKRELSEWLTQYQLTGLAFFLMIPYFGLIHPVLEEVHWSDLREKFWFSHVAFAGYHMIVLGQLLGGIWLFLCFCILLSASIYWRKITICSGSLIPATASHLFADLGIIVAAWILA